MWYKGEISATLHESFVPIIKNGNFFNCLVERAFNHLKLTYDGVFERRFSSGRGNLNNNFQKCQMPGVGPEGCRHLDLTDTICKGSCVFRGIFLGIPRESLALLVYKPAIRRDYCIYTMESVSRLVSLTFLISKLVARVSSELYKTRHAMTASRQK